MTIITTIIFILIGFTLGFLVNAGVVWVLCWGLNAIGITSICGWIIQFSWPLVVVFTIITIIINGFFMNGKPKK